MPTQDQIRIGHDRARPRLMELWWALRPLTSVVRLMQTGAHPDDEISGMLAALSLRDGINISYACSTRGEGGQNDIGTEAGLDLGALRTREMERACDLLNMRMYWHSTHPEDTITDFGFSKSGKDTLARWGYDRTLLRFVDIIRTEKPDIICPTFLDVPGQHGHHRAMTEAAHAVMKAAADPAFPTNLPPWQVKKLYLPAWSGAGQAYDDDLPPPPATLVVQGTDREPMTGWNWDRIGQQSRSFHRSQGMGRWIPAGDGRDWPLHLAETHLPGPDRSLWSGLPPTVGALATLPGADPMAQPLREAQSSIEAAVEAFPHFEDVEAHALDAYTHIETAKNNCPPELSHDFAHRLDAKLQQLAHVIRLALGVEARARTHQSFIDAGKSTEIEVELDQGQAEQATAALELPDGWTESAGRLELSNAARPSDPYPAQYDPADPPRPRLRVSISSGGTSVTAPIAFETPPCALPSKRVKVTPAKAVLNTAAGDRTIALSLSDLSPNGAATGLALPDGWHAERTSAGFDVTAPDEVDPGIYTIAAEIDGTAAETVTLIQHAHIAPTARATPASVAVGVFDVELPDAKVGYIGGGNDRVGHWLSAMGADVTPLDDQQFANETALSGFDTIVIGIFAMRFRPGLREAMPALHRWTEAGGTLVTLYHRPWDNWEPKEVPPRRLEIGQPSLRWRVTDENAEVTYLADHPILETPNKISSEDWSGWVKERGLYFAKDWDPAYTPLLSMADPEEAPLNGSLLVADIGAGRHIHTSLILHHQMEHLVPGAFRLMANFLARRS